MGRRKNEQAFASRDMHLNGGSLNLNRFHALPDGLSKQS
jgi:hypothetical protein